MRGLRKIWKLLQGIKSNRAALISVFVFGVAGISGLSPIVPSAHASGNDIVAGGVWGRDLAGKCGGDVRAIMDHYRIDCNLAGVVEGRACRDGNVYVGDRIVARDSRSIGREPIQGNRSISIAGQTYYETHNSQALLSNCLDTWVKLDGNGSFVYAIIKACGNPIWTPSPVVVSNPQPQPQPQPTPSAPPVQEYAWFCELATKQYRYVKKDQASNGKYGPLSECKEQPKPETPTVAPLTVCKISDKSTVQISDSEYKSNTSLYTTDFTKCQETPAAVQPQEELPQTGIADSLVGGGIGLGSLIVAGSAYVGSRKDWFSALLNR